MGRPTGAWLQDNRTCFSFDGSAANFTSIVLDAALLRRARFLLCNRRYAQQFYWAKLFVGDGQVLVFYFSFEITAARLNLCDGAGLYLRGGGVGVAGLARLYLRAGCVDGGGLEELYVRDGRVDGVGLAITSLRDAGVRYAFNIPGLRRDGASEGVGVWA